MRRDRLRRLPSGRSRTPGSGPIGRLIVELIVQVSRARRLPGANCLAQVNAAKSDRPPYR